MSARARTGMLLGKFLPPHRGHQYLIDFARHHCEHLVVFACSLPTEPIPGDLRYRWLQRAFPTVDVRPITEVVPQYPEEHPQFWDIWRELLRAHLPWPSPEAVYTSDDYGARLAAELGSVWVPVDPARELRPFSGTGVRAGAWEAALPDAAAWRAGQPTPAGDPLAIPGRAGPVRRVCVFGPESTGKSTLTRQLAAHFHDLYVHEYARPLLDTQGGVCYRPDIDRIGCGQRAAEEAMALQARRVLFCDTDRLTTCVWSQALFGEVPVWLAVAAATDTYDLTLLLDVDVPWVDDTQRFLPHKRREFFDACADALTRAGRPFTVIRGGWAERWAQAVAAVQAVLDRG